MPGTAQYTSPQTMDQSKDDFEETFKRMFKHTRAWLWAFGGGDAVALTALASSKDQPHLQIFLLDLISLLTGLGIAAAAIASSFVLIQESAKLKKNKESRRDKILRWVADISVFSLWVFCAAIMLLQVFSQFYATARSFKEVRMHVEQEIKPPHN